MLRSLVLAVIRCLAWPAPPSGRSSLGTYQRKSATAGGTSGRGSRPSSDEYGLEAAEQADYGSFKVTACDVQGHHRRLRSFARARRNVMSRIGNYLVSCDGKCPKDFVKLAEAGCPQFRTPPCLSGRLSARRRRMIPHSRALHPGPVGLQAERSADPGIRGGASVRNRRRDGPLPDAQGQATLAIFSYPTPAMARQQAPAFEGIPGAVVKRTGPFGRWCPLTSDPAADLARLANCLLRFNYDGVSSLNEAAAAGAQAGDRCPDGAGYSQPCRA